SESRLKEGKIRTPIPQGIRILLRQELLTWEPSFPKNSLNGFW
ncbi:hypothetical protein LINPERHAP1_LOCUS29888, partial [Linum perenne]